MIAVMLLTVTCLSAADYQYAKKTRGEKDVYPAPQALDGICSRSLTIDLPQSGGPIDIWIRALGWGMEFNSTKDKKTALHSWIKFNSPGKWVWKKVQTIEPGKWDNVTLIVPKPLNDQNELAAAVDCLVVTQNAELDINKVQQEIVQKLSQPVTNPQILPLPADDLYPVNLEKSANIQLNPTDLKLRVFSEQTHADSRLNLQGMELLLTDKKGLFVGVWKPISDDILKKRDVTVAQGDDKIREATDLPEQVVIPVNANYSALSFLHTVKGAGEFGDVLFNYLVTYDDGSVHLIPVKEGERIGGQLKPTVITQGHEVFDNLVSFRTVSLFISTWKNPAPQKKIQSITLQAVAPKIIPITLGIAGHRILLSSETPPAPQSSAAHTHVDFTQKIKPVKAQLFGINVPYISKADSQEYFDKFRDIDFASVRIWNRIHPVDGQSEPSTESLEKQAQSLIKLVGDTQTRILLNLGSLGKNFPDQDDQLDPYINQRCNWYMRVLQNLIDEHHLPILYIEVFNEELIGHKDAPAKYRFFNALAQRVKADYPQVKIGGTAECWPDVGVMEQFVVSCGKHVDLLTWHMYATGKASTPTLRLMRATDQFAKSSVQIQKMYDKHFPGKSISQAITEYNINYASWKPPYEERQSNGVGSLWIMSVLNHLLYEGQADSAMFWHYFSGGNYGVVDAQYKLKPARTLFYLLNRYLRDAQLCKVESDNDMVEIVATENGSCFVVVTLNKSPYKQQIMPQITGLPSPLNLDMGVSYDIAGEETHFAPNRLTVNQPFELDSYAMRFSIIPK
jgi:hypothetical protein